MRSRLASFIVGLSIAGAASGGIALAVAYAERLPEGPVEIAWDREVCAHCRMHVGDPGFAAEIQTRDRRLLAFDDPGCLLRYEAEHALDVHAVYFHELRGARWIPMKDVAFVEAGPTPMGYGLGAVATGTPGSISLDAAGDRVKRFGGHDASR